MSLPESLQGDRWTNATARAVFPLLVWCAKNGRTITYGQLDKEVVRRGWGHHVMAVQYGYPAGAVGSALIETEEETGESIPPLNAIIVNAKSGLPGAGVNYYLEHYNNFDIDVDSMSLDDRRSVIEDIHEKVFAYEYWDKILRGYGLNPIDDGMQNGNDAEDDIQLPSRGGWSSEGESAEHRTLKEYVALHPDVVGLPSNNDDGETEYLFATGDKADIVFITQHGFLGVEVKSIKSNEADLNRGIFQAIKYQALLRAEQKARQEPPTARAVLVTEQALPYSLQNLADVVGVKVYVVHVNI